MTQQTEQNWQRLNELLDANRDPLEDQVLRDWLAEDSEALEEWAQLRAALRQLEDPAPVANSRRHYALPIAASVLGLFSLQQFAAMGSGSSGTSRAVTEGASSLDAPEPERASLLNFELSIETESLDERVTTVYDGTRHTQTVEQFGPADTASGSSFASTITTTHFQ